MLPNEYFDFFTELAHNNNREWFHKHRDVYERYVREPFLHLVQDLLNEIRAMDHSVQEYAKDAVFRIHRDIRFSADKRPYKEHMAAHISPFGRSNTAAPGFYIEVRATGGSVGGGVYQASKEQLTLVRDLVMHENQTLHRLVQDATFRAYFQDGIVGEKNKVLSAEFKEAAKREPLLYNKQFLWWTNVPKTLLTENNAARALGEYYRAAKPISDFFGQVFTTT